MRCNKYGAWRKSPIIKKTRELLQCRVCNIRVRWRLQWGREPHPRSRALRRRGCQDKSFQPWTKNRTYWLYQNVGLSFLATREEASGWCLEHPYRFPQQKPRTIKFQRRSIIGKDELGVSRQEYHRWRRRLQSWCRVDRDSGSWKSHSWCGR